MINVTKLSVYKRENIISFSQAVSLIARLKKQGKSVGLCHGGFDLLHPGQVKHFESARKLCDVLIVSVTSDRFVVARKGEGRPIFPDTLRAYMIASLSVVDYVIITDFKLGVDVINALKPTYYIKGPDFIGKQTPGITAEREAIAAVGGNMVYTNDPKLSTTEIIEYIQQKIPSVRLLLVIDRDGTIITNDGYFARQDTWREEVKLNGPVVSFLSFLQTKYKTTKIVVSNQSGVARGYFDEMKVEEVNDAVNDLLKKQGIKIDSWQYCPDLDASYARKFPSADYLKKYIKKTTKRKPSVVMVTDALANLKKTLGDFDHVLVLGDADDDRGLARNLNAAFIDVKGASYQGLLTLFQKLRISS